MAIATSSSARRGFMIPTARLAIRILRKRPRSATRKGLPGNPFPSLLTIRIRIIIRIIATMKNPPIARYEGAQCLVHRLTPSTATIQTAEGLATIPASDVDELPDDWHPPIPEHAYRRRKAAKARAFYAVEPKSGSTMKLIPVKRTGNYRLIHLIPGGELPSRKRVTPEEARHLKRLNRKPHPSQIKWHRDSTQS